MQGGSSPFRIASANCGSPWSQTFSYDIFGNLSKSGTQSFQPTYSYLTNHMTQIGSSTPTYDANGNVTNDFLHTYAWDAAGRPVTIDGVGVTYDASGRMVEQNRSGAYSEIVYTPSGAKLALMSGQTLTKAFVPLTGGSMAVYNSSGLAYYRHSDWIGTSRFASTSARALYYDGAYAPFGEAYAQSGTADLSFTGMNQDTVANLYDFPAREYGTQGRWPSPDPAGITSVYQTDPQTWNRYAYVRNTPLQLFDPSGMVIPPPLMIGGGGGGGGFLSWLNNMLMMSEEGLMSEGAFGGGLGCMADGVDASCGMVMSMLGSGAAVQCTTNDCGIGTAAPFRCIGSVCGNMTNEYAFTHENEVNGQLLTNSQYQAYLAATYASQINGQYNTLTGNMAANNMPGTPDANNYSINGGHADFAFNCPDGDPCGPGRYDDGIHVTGDPNVQLWIHDDTVSPWISPFSFSNFSPVSFLEHGFVDLFGGSLCGCVFSQ